MNFLNEKCTLSKSSRYSTRTEAVESYAMTPDECTLEKWSMSVA